MISDDTHAPPQAMAVRRPAGRPCGPGCERTGAAGFLPFTVGVSGPGLPTPAIAIGAFPDPTSGVTLNNINIATNGVYLHGFMTRLELAIVTSVVPGVLGLLIAYAIHTAARAVLRRLRDHRIGRLRQLRRGTAGVPVHRDARHHRWSPTG